MYAAKTPHPYVPEWKKMDMEKKQQSKNRDIEKVLNELLGEYGQNPQIKIQLITKNFLKSVAPNCKTMAPGTVDTEEFQNQYRELIKFLINRANAATLAKPAESILHNMEIKLVILENPKLLEKCDRLSEDLQRFACDLSYTNIKYIKHPLPSLLGGYLSKFPFEISNFPVKCITPAQTINAILKDQLSIQKFDKAAFLKSLQENGLLGLTVDQFVTFITKYPELFTEDDFKSICKIAIEKKDRKLFVSIFALLKHPDENLIKQMIAFAPEQIGEIEKPNTSLQKHALKSAYKNRKSLQTVYNTFVNPSIDVTEYYQLLSLYVNRGVLRDLDATYKSFDNPSKRVREKYNKYKLDCIYRCGDFWEFVRFRSSNLSEKMQARFQKLFLIATHQRYPDCLKEAYKQIEDDPMPDETNYLYAILTAANLLLESLEPYKYQSTNLGNTIPQILSDLITAAKRYSVTEQQLFGYKFWLIQEWIKNQQTK